MKKKLMVLSLFLIVAIIPFFLDYNNLMKNEGLDELIEDLEIKTPDLLSKYNIPGATIALVEIGQLKWVGNFGYADIEDELEIIL